MAGPLPVSAAPVQSSNTSPPRTRRAAARLWWRSPVGRVLLVSAALKVIAFAVSVAMPTVPTMLWALDTLASYVIVGVAGFVLIRGLARFPRLFLWRVRRKLILSYVFIGAVPAALIVLFFLLGGLLLFAYMGSYLVYSELAQVTERAMATARRTANALRSTDPARMETVLAGHRAELTELSSAASIAVLGTTRACEDGEQTSSRTAGWKVETGPWAHVEPPGAVPAWIGCEGSVALLAYQVPQGPIDRAPNTDGLDRAVDPSVGAATRLLVRATAWVPAPPAAVVVDLPVDAAIAARILERSSVQVLKVSVASPEYVLRGRSASGRDEAQRARPATVPADLPIASVSFLEHRDWVTGARSTLYVTLRVPVRGLYSRIAATQGPDGPSLGRGFLIALLVVGALFLLIQFLAIATGLALARSITGSVHELFTGTTRVRQGDFSHRIKVTARDQLGELAQSFNAMTASVESLLVEAGEKKRLEEELRIAHDIQMSLLPSAPDSLPGLSITALCVPAREVGGDYYDLLRLDDYRLGVLIADVAGKGTSAALYMAELKGLVISLSRTCASPRELLVTANRLIARHLAASSFITMIYAVIDVKAGTLTYARAGHTPLLYLPGGSTDRPCRVQVLAPDGLVLGLAVDDGELFERLLEEQTLSLRNGDIFVFYTDGITEAMNAADDCFGEQRLAAAIEAHADLPSLQLRDRLLDAVDAFVNGAPQHDDMTMLLLKIEDLQAGTPLPLADWQTADVGL